MSLQAKEYNDTVLWGQQTLENDEQNAKALFRMGQASIHLGEWDKARDFLKKAQNIQPSDKAIQAELQKIKQHEAKQKQNEKAMFANMFK